MLKNVFNQWVWPLALIVLIVISYYPLYSTGGFIGDLGDPIGQTIPNKLLLIEYIKNGIPPLWNSLSFMGFPFLADIQAGVFYLPDLVIFSIFDFQLAYNVSLLIHISFAAVGMCLFLNDLTKSKYTAFALSLTLALTGSFLTRIVYLNFLETIAFVPWLLFLIQKEKTPIWIFTGTIALMIFAGHPVALFYSFLIITIFLCINHASKVKQLALGASIGFLIAGIQIIPFLFLKEASVRDILSYEDFTGGSLQLLDFFSLMNPFHMGAVPLDKNIYFGAFSLPGVFMSLFWIKKYKGKEKKIYFTGVLLFCLGFVLSLGGNFPFLAKILYHLPVFNVLRVPARYILISHFGIILVLAVWFKHLEGRLKGLKIILLTLMIVTAYLTPSFTLQRVEHSQVEKEYWPDIKAAIESASGEPFELKSPPRYFLSSSFFLFPNRHVLSFMPNLIGYNPMTLKDYYEVFPVSPIGSFENPNYLIDLYTSLEFVGMRYYIFPSSEYLNQKGLEEKEHVRSFLRGKGWNKIEGTSKAFEVWENPNSTPFIYFLNDKNKITAIDFQPGKIVLQASVLQKDTLIVNQTFLPGWTLNTDLDDNRGKAKKFENLIQSYDIPSGAKEITLKYRPRELYYGAFLSLLGVCAIIGLFFKRNDL